MIRNFADKETEKVWNGKRSRKLPSDIQPKSRRLLFQLDSSDILADMRVPAGNRFEELKGNRKGAYSVRINDQWRLTYRWSDGDAHDVRIEDCH